MLCFEYPKNFNQKQNKNKKNKKKSNIKYKEAGGKKKRAGTINMKSILHGLNNAV